MYEVFRVWSERLVYDPLSRRCFHFMLALPEAIVKVCVRERERKRRQSRITSKRQVLEVGFEWRERERII